MLFLFFEIRVPECPNVKNGRLDQYGAKRFARLIFCYSEKKSVGLKGLMAAAAVAIGDNDDADDWRYTGLQCAHSNQINRHQRLTLSDVGNLSRLFVKECRMEIILLTQAYSPIVHLKLFKVFHLIQKYCTQLSDLFGHLTLH